MRTEHQKKMIEYTDEKDSLVTDFLILESPQT
jgi:hypothetical protein